MHFSTLILIHSVVCAAAFGSCVLESSTTLNIAAAFGFAIFVLVYVTASFSGKPHG